MHTAVIRSPQAMSNDQSYRPRSPELPGLADSQQPQQHNQQQHQHQRQHPRLSRLPSYQIQEPSLPKGYSFSPRGSYDASPFFTQPSQQTANPLFSAQQNYSFPEQSPPRFTAASLPDQPQIFSPISYTESPQRQQVVNPFQRSPFQNQQYQQQYQPSIEEMARLRSRKPIDYNEDRGATQYEESMPSYAQPRAMNPMPQQQQPQQLPPSFASHQPQHQFTQQPMHLIQQPLQQPIQPTQPLPPMMSHMPHIDVKTKFPVARIKRIMQADEDVGKVAQATPTAVSKALELFMIALVSKGAAEAKNNNSKRVTATHLKHALLTDPQFDFLTEICEAVPDEGAKGSKGRAKSEAKSEDSDEDMGVAPKKKAKGSRKKKGEEESSD